MPIFTIDGSIGCGKSSVIDYLHTHYHIPVHPEPVDKWLPYLNDIYKNNKGAFEFQVRVWMDRCWMQQRPNMSSIVIERSPYFQSNVFVPANLQSGRLTVREYHMLQEMYAQSSAIWSPNGYIYLRSDPVKCLERIKQRSRPSEEGISISYLYRLHILHEHAYFSAITMGIPVICIDVEGKNVSQIAAEVWSALNSLGLQSNTSERYIQHNIYIPSPQIPHQYEPPKSTFNLKSISSLTSLSSLSSLSSISQQVNTTNNNQSSFQQPPPPPPYPSKLTSPSSLFNKTNLPVSD